MKWKNKGHEFDQIGARFQNIDKIYIYGTGEYGERIGRILNGIDASYEYIDRNNKVTWDGRSTINPTELNKDKLENEHAVIILAMGILNSGIVQKELELRGFSRGKNLFLYTEWITLYSYIFAAYRYNKCILEQCGVMAVYNCTLHCKNCMGAFPYFKEKKNVAWEKVKNDIDICFSMIDYVELWGIGCGEAFLYENISEYISYCMDKYEKQIGTFVLDTNGTIVPKDDVLRIIKHYGCHISISNYHTVDGWKNRVEKLEKKLQEYEISYSFVNFENWIDMGWLENKIQDGNNLLEKFDACAMPCRIVQNGHLNYCIHGMTANQALFHEDISVDEYDLNQRNKKELVEFNLGFNEKGFLGSCAHCNGYANINSNVICVAEQL